MSFFDKAKTQLAKVPLWAWAVGGAGTLLLLGGSTDAGQAAVTGAENMIGGVFDWANEQLFRNAIAKTSAAPYADQIVQASKEYGVDPTLTYAIGAQESGWGTYLDPKGPGGTGDNGHGHGFMQIDDRTWGDWLATADWTDPLTNIRKGLDIFTTQRQSLVDAYTDPTGKLKIGQDDLDRLAIVAYNHGVSGALKNAQNQVDYDTGTTGGNYSASVIQHQDSLIQLMS